MQVTFLIGNGFDLNLGLKTKYTDFYPLYLNDPEFATSDPEIRQFKELLGRGGDYSCWADFERSLGKHTMEPPLNQEESLRKCLKDFKRCFASYLQRQEARIHFKNCGRKMAQDFAAALYTHMDRLEPRPLNLARTALPLRETINYHVLDFNYTTVIDRIFPLILSSDLHGNVRGSLIHVHGTHTTGMILGVDNIAQVANSNLFTTPRQRRMFLKPLLNQQSGQGHDQEALNCIKQSDEICIFGMSLGETDLTWWQRIGHWLIRDQNHQLLIFTRGRGLNPLFSEDVLDYQDEIRDLFLSRTEISAEERASLRDQIHIVITSDFFRFETALEDPLIGDPPDPPSA